MTDLAIANIHDAIHDAVIGKKRYKREPKQNITVRLDPEKKDLMIEILGTNGTSPSDFYRACTDHLLKDFMGPKAFAELEARLAKIPVAAE